MELSTTTPDEARASAGRAHPETPAAPIVPLVGWALDGARVTARGLRSGSVGEPVWGPRGFLADLELRAGIAAPRIDPMARLFEIRARAEALAVARPGVFFARSLAVDPWATSSSLLAMRDELVLAGWQGEIRAWGARSDPKRGHESDARLWRAAGETGDGLGAFARLEALAALTLGSGDELGPLPPGEVDRVVRVERALTSAPYPRIILVEPMADWPLAWQRLWTRLEGLGVTLEHETGATIEDGSGSDLARLREALRDGVPAGERFELSGDGSFVVLNAETPDPLGEATAALIAAELAAAPERCVAILRTAENGALEAALPRFGLPRLGGLRSPGVPLAGAWLPLVLALTTTPFDAEAAVDLLLMPQSGLQGKHAGILAAALQEAPGLGARWATAVDKIRQEEQGGLPDAVERMLGWLRPSDALTADELIRRVTALDRVLATRVIAHRLPPDSAPRTPTGDLASIDALEAARTAVAAWLRALPEELGRALVEGHGAGAALDALLQTFGAITASTLTQHEAGALERVDDPAALCTTVDTLVWWGFVDPGSPATSAFRGYERAALATLGVALEAPEAAVRRRATAWRSVLDRARRVVLVVPGRIAGAMQAPHPLWAEIRGRLRWESDDLVARVMTTPAEVIARGLGHGHDRVTPRSETIGEARWARASTMWRVPPEALGDKKLIADDQVHTVSALETLLKCPLRFVLERRARLNERAVGVVRAMPVLLGNLGHHLVEALFGAGQLSSVHGTTDTTRFDLEGRIAALINDEVAVLNMPGRRAERDEVVRQLAASVRSTIAWLEREGLTPRAVEEAMELACGARRVSGRLDLRAERADGETMIVDFKWSTRKHAEALAQERAVQLAAYAERYRTGEVAAGGAYVGLGDGRVVTADGALLQRTWRRVVTMLGAVEGALAAGHVHVTGVAGAVPLMDTLEVTSGVAADPKTICDYCRFDLVCGKGLAYAPEAEGDDDDEA